jgi:hypothetical protein
VIGKFDKIIEMSSKIASCSFFGKYDNAFAMPYENKNFAFFLDTAFLKFKTEKDFSLPYTYIYRVTIG